jgi:hypothetical protein
MERIAEMLIRIIKKWFTSSKPEKQRDPDVGKCTTCRFADRENDQCTAGTYWAEKGFNAVCYGGELWENVKNDNELNKN